MSIHVRNEPRSSSFSPYFHIHVLFWMQTEEQKAGPGNEASPGTQVWILRAGWSAAIVRVGLQVCSCWRMNCTEWNNWDFVFAFTLLHQMLCSAISLVVPRSMDQDLCHHTLSFPQEGGFRTQDVTQHNCNCFNCLWLSDYSALQHQFFK